MVHTCKAQIIKIVDQIKRRQASLANKLIEDFLFFVAQLISLEAFKLRGNIAKQLRAEAYAKCLHLLAADNTMQFLILYSSTEANTLIFFLPQLVLHGIGPEQCLARVHQDLEDHLAELQGLADVPAEVDAGAAKERLWIPQRWLQLAHQDGLHVLGLRAVIHDKDLVGEAARRGVGPHGTVEGPVKVLVGQT